MAGPCREVTKERIRDWARWQRCLSDGSPSQGAGKSTFTEATAKSIDYPDYPEDAALLDRIISSWATSYNRYKAGTGDVLFACLQSINAEINTKKACEILNLEKDQFSELQEEAIDITHLCLHPDSAPELFN